MNYDFYTAPPDYGSYRQKRWELKREFPFLQTGTIGRSLLGRNIYALTLGASSPCTLFVGGIQAQDWLTCSLLVRFLEHLCLSYRQQTSIAGSLINGSLMNRGVTVIPLANPDGAAIAMGGPSTAGNMAPRLEQMLSANPAPWNANARGVDLCRNFDASFLDRKQLETEEGITGPGPRWYGGAFPHSEPESRALISLLRGRRVESLYDFQMDGEHPGRERPLHPCPEPLYRRGAQPGQRLSHPAGAGCFRRAEGLFHRTAPPSCFHHQSRLRPQLHLRSGGPL